MSAAHSPSGDARIRSSASRTLVVTFLGAVVRPMGDWMPIAGAIGMLASVDLDAPTVRTAVFRLKKRGWLAAHNRNGTRGYVLTDHAIESLRAGDEVIWHARRPADVSQGWCIVNFSVPESQRSKRHQLRAHLATLGFGNVGTAMWIAPARMLPAAERAISELGLTESSAVFVGDYVAGQDLAELAYASWDLDGINDRYREFIDAFAPLAHDLKKSRTREPGELFATYLTLIDSWRKLPFRDPGLPTELLAPDWRGPAAAELFEQLVESLRGPALEYAASHWPTAP